MLDPDFPRADLAERRPHVRTGALVGLVVSLLLACGGDEGPVAPAPPVLTSLIVHAERTTLVVGQSTTLTASGRDQNGNPIAAVGLTWRSTAPEVATVNAGGVATAVGAGTVHVIAAAGEHEGRLSLTITAVPAADVRVTSIADSLLAGRTHHMTATVVDANGAELTDRTVSWQVDDSTVARVSPTGLVTARRAGEATVSVSVAGAAGPLTASAIVRVWANPVFATSYENFKNAGVTPLAIPLPNSQFWGATDVVARGYGDFFLRGVRDDLFTARIVYGTSQPEATAPRAEYTFWRRSDGSYVADASILMPPARACLHPRKALVADFNLDARPDVFVICHGYDAAPFPGERNQVVLSSADGRYQVYDAAPDIGFWHGGAAADLNGDAYPDVIVVNDQGVAQAAVFLNNGDGTFTREIRAGRLPTLGSPYFSAELADVDEDGTPDLLLGGHESENAPTQVYINPGSGMFAGVSPVTLPAVSGDGAVIDFALTGTGASRTIWISRTSDGEGTFYSSRVLQRFGWPTRTGSVVVRDQPGQWVPWILPYQRGAMTYLGSDDPRTPLEVVVP